jgi:predicted CopG family antitoxin
VTKTLTIRDEVYNKLLMIKREDESFSDLFLRLSEEQDTMQLLESLRGTVDIPDTEQLLSEVRAKRAEKRYDNP